MAHPTIPSVHVVLTASEAWAVHATIVEATEQARADIQAAVTAHNPSAYALARGRYDALLTSTIALEDALRASVE